MGFPNKAEWTIGLLVVAQRHRRSGLASSVLTWLAQVAADQGATHLRAVLRDTNQDGLDFAAARGFAPVPASSAAAGFVVVTKPLTIA